MQTITEKGSDKQLREATDAQKAKFGEEIKRSLGVREMRGQRGPNRD
jgi:hypothetical protein